jgi:thiol-disulfide isomerase/thioredoxin
VEISQNLLPLPLVTVLLLQTTYFSKRVPITRLFFLGSIVIVAILVAACGSDSPQSTEPVSAENHVSSSLTGDRNELQGIDTWINSEPFTIADQLEDNKVVLVDFWTYTCVNCLRTLPFLQDWYEKYSDHGLVLIGVHSPEFEFEKVVDNVAEASEREGVFWPIALDNDFETWRAFSNRYWPAKYLINPDGEIVYQHFGEGAYVEAEEAIREALTNAGNDISDIPLGSVNNPDRDPNADRYTRELYAGYERNFSINGLYAGQEQYYLDQDRVREYVDDGVYELQKWYLQGNWQNGPESIIHARETSDLEDHIAFKFVGRSANVVIDPTEPGDFDVYVEIDDRPLREEEAGDDIEFDSDGNSYFTVNEARMYKFLEIPQFSEHVLKLSSNSDKFAIFAFTFGNNRGGF